MAYLYLNDLDCSMYCNKLKIGTEHHYAGGTTASGLIKARYKGTSKVLEIGFVALDADVATNILSELDRFTVTVSYLEPLTNTLKTIDCIAPQNAVEYYTINAGDTKLQAFTVSLKEALLTSPFN